MSIPLIPGRFRYALEMRSQGPQKCNQSVTEAVMKIGGHIIKQNIPVHDVSQTDYTALAAAILSTIAFY
jgi:hypothetical protein